MIKRLFQNRHLWNTIPYLFGFSGASFAAYHFIENDIYHSGVFRFSRAGLVAIRTICDYKVSLWLLNCETEEYNKAMAECHRRGATRFLELAQRNGGVFIKVGQHISSLYYLLPTQYTSTLSVLHSTAPKSNFDEIKKVFSQSLNAQLYDIFDKFDEIPCGVASLAQVHRAKLKNSDQIVAVKIQHPKVKARSYVDIATMEFFVKVASFVFPNLRLKWLVDEVKKNLPRELDFLQEAKNAERVRCMFQHLSWLKIPKIFYEISSDKVLTMEFFSGGYVNDLDYYVANNLDKHDICRKLGRLYSEMIFVKGSIHCDPHPGNILVRRDSKKGHEIVLLDHGLYVNLPDHLRLNYAKLWIALIKPDMKDVHRICDKMGIGDHYQLFACILTLRPWRDLTMGIAKTNMDELKAEEVRKFATALADQITVVLDSMPRQILLILKTNDLLRSIAFCLKSENRLETFTEMSRCCVRAIYSNKISSSCSNLKKGYFYATMLYLLVKIRLFELYLIAIEKFKCLQ